LTAAEWRAICTITESPNEYTALTLHGSQLFISVVFVFASSLGLEYRSNFGSEFLVFN